MSVSTPKQPKNKKLLPLLGGHLDGLSVDPADVKEGVYSAKIVMKIHDFGNGEREPLWLISKNALHDMTVYYKLDGNKLYYSHREPAK